MTTFAAQDYLDLDRTAHRMLFAQITHVWEALEKIPSYLQFSLQPGLDAELIGCYVRENVVVGDGVVLGNSCEFKNCLIFDEAQVPHFNYVGDSILGYKSHLGAGVILSNVKLDHGEIFVEAAGERIPSNLRKFGAVVGDEAEIGCHAVLNPGSIIGRRAIVYPGAQWRGVLPADSIAKYRQSFSVLARRT
jgi:bifunctional N-acetylglucosamine-1-phosphate-uridyltransferase/glucosamine-1-phosphate-acetyltransferase GlmU-like protein